MAKEKGENLYWWQGGPGVRLTGWLVLLPESCLPERTRRRLISTQPLKPR